MALRFAYTRPDGGISIVNAIQKIFLERTLGPLTDEAYRAHVIEKSKPADATDWHELPEDLALPDDRTFRNAWKRSGKGVAVDMPKARELHKEYLRALRAPKLAELDVEYQIADETENRVKKQEIAGKKLALRDVTDDPAIEASKTPEELKAVIPDVLRS